MLEEYLLSCGTQIVQSLKSHEHLLVVKLQGIRGPKWTISYILNFYCIVYTVIFIYGSKNGYIC